MDQTAIPRDGCLGFAKDNFQNRPAKWDFGQEAIAAIIRIAKEEYSTANKLVIPKLSKTPGLK